MPDVCGPSAYCISKVGILSSEYVTIIYHSPLNHCLTLSAVKNAPPHEPPCCHSGTLQYRATAPEMTPVEVHLSGLNGCTSGEPLQRPNPFVVFISTCEPLFDIFASSTTFIWDEVES